MPVVGIPSHTLFALEERNRMFGEEGLEAYSRYLLPHEDDWLTGDTALPLIQALKQSDAA